MITERVIRATLRTFVFNLGLQLVLHPFFVLAFFVPLVLGLYTGWTLKASRQEGIGVGLCMGTYMTLFMLVVGVPFLFILNMGHMWWLVPVIAIFVFLHVGVFAGGGAIAGGHYARKEEAAAAVS